MLIAMLDSLAQAVIFNDMADSPVAIFISLVIFIVFWLPILIYILLFKNGDTF